MKLQFNKIFISNIVVCLILIYVIITFNQYYVYQGHDYFWTNTSNGTPVFQWFLEFDRKLPTLLCFFINNYLPNILNIPEQDFAAGNGNIIKSIIFFLTCFVVVLGFYISYNLSSNYKRENHTKNGIIGKLFFSWESLLILPLTVFLFLLPNVYFFKHYNTSYILEQTIIYLEYFFPLLFYFLFFIFFMYIIRHPFKKINIFTGILIMINSFLLSLCNELYNVSILFSLIVLTLLIWIYKKELFKKELLILIIPFLAGCLYFFLSSKYLSGDTVAFRPFHWDKIISNINLINFSKEYIGYMFLRLKYFYIVIFILSFLLLKKKNSQINILIITCISMILGYLLTNFVFIIFSEIDNGLFFARTSHQCIYFHILSFVFITFTGGIYFEYKEARKYTISAIILLLIIFCCTYYTNNKIVQNIMLDRRITIYRFEKICIIYSIFGECALIPRSLLENNNLVEIVGDPPENDIVDTYNIFFTYAQNTYKMNFFGFQFKNKDYADTQYLIRLKILGEVNETDEELIKNKVSFKSLDKYKGLKLTLDDIDKIEKNSENKDILLKAKAYINYRDGNLEEALKLYKEYLKSNTNDYDAKYRISEILNKLQQNL